MVQIIIEFRLKITYYFNQFIDNNILKISPRDKYILFHIGENDVTHIAKHYWGLPSAKHSKAVAVAQSYVKSIVDLSNGNPDVQIFVSTLVPRFDGACQEYLRKVINDEIKNGFLDQVF